MKIIKKYVAIQINTSTINDEYVPTFTYGDSNFDYRIRVEFDSEEEAINYAYSISKYKNWLIVPLIKFDIID